MSEGAQRIVLAERAAGPDHALTFDAEAFSVEGVPLLPNRRVALRDVHGLERAGGWLWIGAGLVPVVLGGEDVAAERLAQVEASLHARIGASPGGAGRLARFAARPRLSPRLPWLTVALAAGLGLAFGFGSALDGSLRFVTDLLLLLSFGLLLEPWLGPLRLLASGGSALALASVLSASAAWIGQAPLALALGLAGLLLFLRFRREPVLSVRLRSALDLGVLLTALLLAHALSVAGGVALLAVLAGFGLAPLGLRRWPEGTRPRLH